jgi:hypothetical protein
MSGAGTLLPLRVPELGPYLGKVVSGTNRVPGGVRLDDVRLRLATRIFHRAGEARRLASREERGPAIAAIGRTAWLEAWEEAVTGAAALLADRIAVQLESEARAARLPGRRRRRLLPGPEDRRALAARIGSAGAVLVAALDEVERHGVEAVGATGLAPGLVGAWQEALCTAGRRLEAAWLGLEDAVALEADRWSEVADEVSRWRRPLWPVLAAGAVAVALAIWLGLVLGGFVTPPRWLTDVWRSVFAS